MPHIAQSGDLRIKQRHVNGLSFAAFLAFMKGGEAGDGAVESRDDIGDSHPHLDGRAVRLTSDAHQAAHGLHEKIIAAASGVGSRLPKARDGTINQSGIDFGECFVIQSVFFEIKRAKVFNENVGFGGKRAEDVLSIGVGDIKGKRAFVAIDACPVGAIAGVFVVSVFDVGRSHAAGVIASGGVLYFDDIRTKVAKNLGGGGTRQHPSQINNPHITQRAR